MYLPDEDEIKAVKLQVDILFCSVIIFNLHIAVRKLRIVPKRKLKSTNSMRGAISMHAGADYVRHVSSLVKNGINSLKIHSSLLTCEGLYFLLKDAFSSIGSRKQFT